MHRVVKTGSELDWIEPDRMACPHCQKDLTQTHIFVECPVAGFVWEEVSEIWEWLSGETLEIEPMNLDELKAIMALGPGTLKGQKLEAWKALYRTAVWCLWKSYLSFSFKNPEDYWHYELATKYYRKMISDLILTERSLCLNETYSNTHYSQAKFKRRWKQDARKLKILRGPACLSRTESPEEPDDESDLEEEDEEYHENNLGPEAPE